MKRVLFQCFLLIGLLLPHQHAAGQAPGVRTYVNPVIPGDHPDATLTRIGDDYYTTGSSFNVTPKIYHSTDLVHWRVIAQPVPEDWSLYGDVPAGGIWGGHMVLYNDQYWHFFGRGTGSWDMHFVTADKPEGPWSEPTLIRVPAGLDGFGVDNSIFIDDDNRWFLLTKAGRGNNHLVELGPDGQPTGFIYDLTWLNPEEEGHPYSWAEGPVMWKRDGFYYYSFAQHLAGLQYVMKSAVKDAPLSDDPEAWETPRVLFQGARGDFATPNHSSPAVTAPDGTSWIISQSYDGSGGNEWQAMGRQGLLSQVVYDSEGWPTAQYPRGIELAPDLPGSGIPWTVPRSDMFEGDVLAPDWSFLGRTPTSSYSLTERPGWLRLTPKGGRRFPFVPGRNTVIQNAAQKAYSLVTRIDFNPENSYDEGGLWTINGPERLYAKVYVGAGSSTSRAVTFSFDETAYSADVNEEGPVWLKMERDGHDVTGSYSTDGIVWTQVGQPIDVSRMDRHQPSEEIDHDFNSFTGNQQGLYVVGSIPADFDLYVYNDAYSTIQAGYPANYYGVQTGPRALRDVHDGDWAMYAGIEFGAPNDHSHAMDYPWVAEQIVVTASSAETGGRIDIWLDDYQTGTMIGSVDIEPTGAWDTYHDFVADIDGATGQRDVYLVFSGEAADELLRIQEIRFDGQYVGTSASPVSRPGRARLEQNYPNPFGAEGTSIDFHTPRHGQVSLTVFNMLGQQVASLVDTELPAGRHSVAFDGEGLASGVYVYRLRVDDESVSRQMVLRK